MWIPYMSMTSTTPSTPALAINTNTIVWIRTVWEGPLTVFIRVGILQLCLLWFSFSMACLDMYNNSDHKGQYCAPMSPRISFSNDFADSQRQIVKQESRSSSSRDPAPVSTDFEFSVTNNYSMMSGADELFFKGRLLPFKDNHMNNKTTLRDELLAGHDSDDDIMSSSHRPPKSSTRWKGLLGLKRSHIGSSKKAEKSSEVCESRRPGFVHEEMNKTSQEMFSEATSSNCRDNLEVGI